MIRSSSALWICAIAAAPQLAAAQCKAELKVLLMPGELGSTVRSLKMQAMGDKDVWFFDTADAQLIGRGVVLRIRIGLDNDLTVKVRPGRPWAPRAGSQNQPKCESDVVGSSVQKSYSISRYLRPARVSAEGWDLQALLSDAQRVLIHEFAGQLNWPELRAYGPIRASEWRSDQAGGFAKVALERWSFRGLQLLELSTKVDAEAAIRQRDELVRLVRRQRLRLDPEQSSKTARVLLWRPEPPRGKK